MLSFQFEVVSAYKLQVSSLRLDYHYILWYKNIATFACTMVVPFVLLAYWNTQTYHVLSNRTNIFSTHEKRGEKDTFCIRMLKKARLQNCDTQEGKDDELCKVESKETSRITSSKDEASSKGDSNGNSRTKETGVKTSSLNEITQQQHPNEHRSATAHETLQQGSNSVSKIKREEDGKARILFVVIFIFLACNTPRFVLNFEECLAGRDYTAAAKAGCNLHPFWALVLNHISQLFICVNSSLGFVIYCVMSRDFRNVIMEKIKKYF